MAQKRLRAFTAPKHPGTPNEDRWAANSSLEAIAVSDGASVSFDPAPWADMLAAGFVADETIDGHWLSQLVDRYAASYDRDAMDWMQQGAFDRGSFASLLGVRWFSGASRVEVVCIGDTLLALLDGTDVRITAPYTDPAEFDARPRLLATQSGENEDLIQEGALALTTYDLADFDNPVLALMTDALGHWLLTFPERAPELLAIEDQDTFENFVEQERSANHMRRDDTTLVILD